VRALTEYRAWLVENGVEPALSGRGVPVSGLGSVDLIAVRDPDGSLTEFYDVN
jgi:hypothetical protein